MHVALKIHEVVSIICDFVAGLGDHAYQHRGLVNFALTCRSFLEPSLNALWETLPSLFPLFFCLPKDIFRLTTIQANYSRRRLKMARTPTPDEWARVLYYTPRVRRVEYTGDSPASVEIAPSCFEALALSFPGSVLFPNARRLYIDLSVYKASLSFTRLLVSPSITDIGIDWTEQRTALQNASIASLLGARCRPTVLSFDRYCSAYESTSSPVILDMLHAVISEWPQLQVVTLTFIYAKTLRRMASFPDLETLAVNMYGRGQSCIIGDVVPIDDSESTFPALYSLTIMQLSPEMADWVLSLITKSPVEDLSLGLNKPAPAQKWSPIFRRLAGWASREVETLSLDLSERVYYEDEEEEEELLDAITVDDLEPLFRLRIVTSLTLDLRWLMINDEMLARIAAAWPMLNGVKFQDYNPKLQGAFVTLDGLAIIAQRCSQLDSLANLPLNTSITPAQPLDIPIMNPLSAALKANLSVTAIDVGSSPAPQDPGFVARFLTLLCPNLRAVSHPYTEAAWKAVHDLLPHMKQARMESYAIGHAMALAGVSLPHTSQAI
ncbi:uncharacterized protein SCHCODRAFT_02009514 [Schizophyllum commune H4-8]|uniref:uncharacterized protein n=1 Tax=Schizophyllum commune (strain H4-8 / FGSC 9210) TaxID=578458 RepID=UPI00215F9DF9|nr:uncharacterized protein SCHCODRAFT_02009514 [Schizophyllum commune H4-8]KAI5899351.1 hypothetical protein SCHCODRAFT_02009514 [Schizophyllum commune H4-8]